MHDKQLLVAPPLQVKQAASQGWQILEIESAYLKLEQVVKQVEFSKNLPSKQVKQVEAVPKHV